VFYSIFFYTNLSVELHNISLVCVFHLLFLSFRIILDEAALHLSDKCNTVTVNLHRGKDVLDVTNELQSLKKQNYRHIQHT